MAFDGRIYRTPGLTPILSHYPDAAYTSRAWSNALRSAYYINRFASRVVMAQSYGRNQFETSSMYDQALLYGTGYHPISEGDFYAHDEVTHIAAHIVFAANASANATIKHRVTISDGVSSDVTGNIQTLYSSDRAVDLPESVRRTEARRVLADLEMEQPLFARGSFDVSSLTTDRDWRVLIEVQSGETGNEYLYWPVFSMAFWEVKET